MVFFDFYIILIPINCFLDCVGTCLVRRVRDKTWLSKCTDDRQDLKRSQHQGVTEVKLALKGFSVSASKVNLDTASLSSAGSILL